MNLASVVILLLVLALAFLAVKVLRSGKSTCSYGENPKKPKDRDKCAGCTADCPFKR